MTLYRLGIESRRVFRGNYIFKVLVKTGMKESRKI